MGTLLMGVLAWVVVRGARIHRLAIANMEQALQEAALRERELLAAGRAADGHGKRG